MNAYRRFRAFGFPPKQAHALAAAGYTVWFVSFDALLAEPTLDPA